MERKLYTFPDALTIVERMAAVESTESDALSAVKLFAEKEAGKTLNVYGVNLGWEFAIYEIAQRPGAVPMLSFMMGFRFNEYMTALITEDAEFLAELLAIRVEMKR